MTATTVADGWRWRRRWWQLPHVQRRIRAECRGLSERPGPQTANCALQRRALLVFAEPQRHVFISRRREVLGVSRSAVRRHHRPGLSTQRRNTRVADARGTAEAARRDCAIGERVGAASCCPDLSFGM